MRTELSRLFQLSRGLQGVRLPRQSRQLRQLKQLRIGYDSKTGEIDSYEVSGNLTDFPRGVFLAYGDYITAGLKSKQDAEKWASEWSACPKCKSSRHGKHGDPCHFCKTPLINAAQQNAQITDY
ncbi:MAG: hypothetical protein ABTQ25_09505 [Nitrosomonas ureae]